MCVKFPLPLSITKNKEIIEMEVVLVEILSFDHSGSYFINFNFPILFILHDQIVVHMVWQNIHNSVVDFLR